MLWTMTVGRGVAAVSVDVIVVSPLARDADVPQQQQLRLQRPSAFGGVCSIIYFLVFRACARIEVALRAQG